jgi:hypothetical protein
MPIRHTDKGWYWGSKGPFVTRAKAQQVATAAYASGYKEEKIVDKNAIGEFIGNLFHSATVTHFMHLQTKSYAQHIALGAYYEEIVELVDSVAETIQGCYGEIITGYPTMFANVGTEPLEYLKSLQTFVADARANLPQESNIQNEIDNVATLIDSTIYKLKFLA